MFCACLSSASDLIVNVEVSLVLILAHHPRLLQQEVWDFATVWLSSSAELNLKVFPLVDAKVIGNKKPVSSQIWLTRQVQKIRVGRRTSHHCTLILTHFYSLTVNSKYKWIKINLCFIHKYCQSETKLSAASFQIKTSITVTSVWSRE